MSEDEKMITKANSLTSDQISGYRHTFSAMMRLGKNEKEFSNEDISDSGVLELAKLSNFPIGTVDVLACAHCGKDHKSLEYFEDMGNGIDAAWFLCPNSDKTYHVVWFSKNNNAKQVPFLELEGTKYRRETPVYDARRVKFSCWLSGMRAMLDTLEKDVSGLGQLESNVYFVHTYIDKNGVDEKVGIALVLDE